MRGPSGRGLVSFKDVVSFLGEFLVGWSREGPGVGGYDGLRRGRPKTAGQAAESTKLTGAAGGGQWAGGQSCLP